MLTLHRLANTWYTGANVPGKSQGVMPYTGGVGPYRGICNEVVSRGMLGFSLDCDLMFKSSATTARSFACSQTCGWC